MIFSAYGAVITSCPLQLFYFLSPFKPWYDHGPVMTQQYITVLIAFHQNPCCFLIRIFLRKFVRGFAVTACLQNIKD